MLGGLDLSNGRHANGLTEATTDATRRAVSWLGSTVVRPLSAARRRRSALRRWRRVVRRARASGDRRDGGWFSPALRDGQTASGCYESHPEEDTASDSPEVALPDGRDVRRRLFDGQDAWNAGRRLPLARGGSRVAGRRAVPDFVGGCRCRRGDRPLPPGRSRRRGRRPASVPAGVLRRVPERGAPLPSRVPAPGRERLRKRRSGPRRRGAPCSRRDPVARPDSEARALARARVGCRSRSEHGRPHGLVRDHRPLARHLGRRRRSRPREQTEGCARPPRLPYWRCAGSRACVCGRGTGGEHASALTRLFRKVRPDGRGGARLRGRSASRGAARTTVDADADDGGDADADDGGDADGEAECEPLSYYGPRRCASDAGAAEHGPGWYCAPNTYPTAAAGPTTGPDCRDGGPVDAGGE